MSPCLPFLRPISPILRRTVGQSPHRAMTFLEVLLIMAAILLVGLLFPHLVGAPR